MSHQKPALPPASDQRPTGLFPRRDSECPGRGAAISTPSLLGKVLWGPQAKAPLADRARAAAAASKGRQQIAVLEMEEDSMEGMSDSLHPGSTAVAAGGLGGAVGGLAGPVPPLTCTLAPR